MRIFYFILVQIMIFWIRSDVECVPLHIHLFVWSWSKGRLPNICLLVAGNRHLVQLTCDAGAEGVDWCPSLLLKSSVHPSTPSHCTRGSREPQLNTDLPEQTQVQQGVCSTAKWCTSVSLGWWAAWVFLSLIFRGTEKPADASVWSECQNWEETCISRKRTDRNKGSAHESCPGLD